MVLQNNDRKTCFSFKKPNFCAKFLCYVAEISENEYLHCVGHVLRFLKHI